MKRITFILMLFIFLIPPAFSQLKAVIKEVSGKVEIKAPQKGWEPAKAGMDISKGTIISTGFKSQALLELGASELYVKQLTRMRLDELIQKEGTRSTGLYLKVGKVRAKVKSVEGLRHNFKLKSPISTAAVRGSELDYDGMKLKVYEVSSVIILTNLLGHSRTVGAGQSSKTSGYDPPTRGEDGRGERSNVNPYTSRTGGIASGFEGPTTLVTIEFDW